MNKQVVNTISEFTSPIPQNDKFASNCISISYFHRAIFFLNEQGNLRCMGLDNSSSSHSVELQCSDNIVDMNITNIEFNKAGTMLIIWGPMCLGVVSIPSLNEVLEKENEILHVQFQILYSSKDANMKDVITKVRWHPMCEHHVVLLVRTEILYVVDVVLADFQEVPLKSNTSYASFCFGPEVDWMRFSVLLLEESGAVSLLCPIIPLGAIVSRIALDEIRDWMDEQDFKSASSTYEDDILSFLRCSFGLEATPHDSLPNMYRVGTDNRRSRFDKLPSLQGPLDIDGRIAKIPKSSDRDQTCLFGKACDICCPSFASFAGITSDDLVSPPVFLVSWTSGNIEQIIISTQICPLWVAESPTDTMSFINRAVTTRESCPLPQLVHVSTTDLYEHPQNSEISKTRDDIFVLISDPASVYQIHVIACNSGVAYTLRMPWIKKIVFQLENSSHHASEKEPFLKQASNATTAKLIFQPVKDTSVNKDALMTRLGAAVLILDPVLGHLMMLRTLSGHLTIINLTVLDKLYLLETKLQDHETGLVSTKGDESGALFLREERSLGHISNKLIVEAQHALEVAKVSFDSRNIKNQDEAIALLVKVKNHLEENVIVPLDQLTRRIQASEQVIQIAYRSQVDLIKERGPDSIDEKLKRSLERQTALKIKLDLIRENLDKQKQLSSNGLLVSIKMRTHLTRAEKIYIQQLREWNRISKELETSIEGLVRSQSVALNSHAALSPAMIRNRSRMDSSRLQHPYNDVLAASEEDIQNYTHILEAEKEIMEECSDAAAVMESKIEALKRKF